MDLLLLFIFLLGILIGSFLNVCIGRIPLGKSIAYPPSHCPKCHTFLKPLDLVPIISYLFLRGKCKYCGDKISPQYPIIEFINGLIYLIFFLKFGFTILTLKYAIFSSLLLVVGIVDYNYKIIPNGLIIFGLITGLVFHFINGLKANLLLGIIGFFIGGGIFLLIALVTKGAMGGGDIKLMAVIGFWFGWKYLLVIMLLSFIIGAIFSVALLLLKIKGRKDEIPFGPFIAASTIITLYSGEEILHLYITKLMT